MFDLVWPRKVDAAHTLASYSLFTFQQTGSNPGINMESFFWVCV